MAAAGRKASTYFTPGERIRVQPWEIGDHDGGFRLSALPARNLRDSVNGTVTAVDRVAAGRGGFSQRARTRIQLTIALDDGRTVVAHFAPIETQMLAREDR